MPGLPEPGVEWNGFRIEERIGAGGFGQVFAAWDQSRDRRVVVKVIPESADAAAKKRFLRESRVAADLDHPRVVPIHRVAETDGMAHVVMGHVAGGDLAQQIHIAPLTVDRARSVLGQIGGALDRAHRAGLVHRGVEPANILCAEDGDDVYLTDFGAPAASVHYAAPELVRGEVLTPAADVYGLGCTLFECLTGRVPFPGATPDEVAEHHLGSPPPRVTDLRPDLSSEFDEIVARAMAKDPVDRHPTARHLAEAVALVRADEWAVDAGAVTKASFAVTAAQDVVESELETVRRSVFDDTTAMPTVAPPAPATAAPDGDPDGGPDDGAVDGAAFGIYEDERRRTWVVPTIVAVLVVLILVVGALVWRAANTDAELAGSDRSNTTDPVPDVGVVEPTMANAEALLPEGIDSCVSPEGEAAAAAPIVLLCPLDGTPESLSLELFASDEERDARVDALAAVLRVPHRDDAECALGRTGRHPYRAADHGGEVLCTQSAGAVEFVWTRDDAAVVLRARGGGRFAEHEAAWESMAERTDAEFPIAEEQKLLDAIPDEYLVDCTRDLTLALETRGEVAAACRPNDEAPTVISWVLFAGDEPMDGWIADRRDSLDENNFDVTDDGCSPQGFGQVATITEAPEEEGEEEAPVSGPAPDAAYLDYDFEGTGGKVLCFINTTGLNAIFWTRNGTRIGSIAVSDRNDGDSMVDLLRWWRDGGHRP